MVSALIWPTQSACREPYVPSKKKRQSVGSGGDGFFGQWAEMRSQPDVCAVGGGGVKWIGHPSPVYCPGHNDIVGSYCMKHKSVVCLSCGSVSCGESWGAAVPLRRV